MSRPCMLSSHLREECPDHGDHCVCVHDWDSYEMPKTPLVGVVPGGSQDTQAFRDHMNWDRDLNSYAGARKAGLQPDKTTRKAVFEAEATAESHTRALGVLDGHMDTSGLKVAKGVR